MTSPRIGSLCSGYGGLELGVQAAIGGSTAWVSDIDKGACKILAHRFPDVPNIGDMTTVDWSQVEPVDVLTAGYPCQPFSHAGKRKGTNDVRHLWPHVRDAIRVLRPRITVLENVSGHRSLGFDRVLGDMAEDGMDVGWASPRASDSGAPHQRERLFIVVRPAGHSDVTRLERWWPSGRADQWTPRPAGVGSDLTLLPTPAVNDMGAGKTVEDWDTWTAKMQSAHGNGNGHGKSLAIEAQRFDRWGEYEPAITHWEYILDRPAPAPTHLNGAGRPQLSPAFVEWMMGLPAGWVTDVPGITRNEALKACGNGVVPQQAEAAIRFLMAATTGVAA